MNMSRTEEKTLPYADPLSAGRHPFQTYLLTLAMVSGIPLLFGEATNEAVENHVPAWLAYTWGVFLVVGSAIALLGSFWPRKDYANALTMERLGLGLAGSAACVYGLLVFASNGISRLVAAAIILAFGLSCIRRALDIARIFKRARQEISPRVETEDE